MPSSETESNVAVADVPTSPQDATVSHAAETEVYDGVLYGSDGEILGLADQTDRFAPSDDADEAEASRVMRSMSLTHHRIVGATARATSIEDELQSLETMALAAIRERPEYKALLSEREQALTIAKEATRRLDWLKTSYTEFLRLFALPRLGGTSRTLKTLAGSISLRKVSAKIEIEDEERAVASLVLVGEKNAIKHSVLKSGISDELRAQLLAGEAALTGITVAPESTKVGVSVGGVQIV